jgi:hypothetical protein
MAMDIAERTRLKTLANDAVIATFGVDGRESRLATALESAVEELAHIATECDHCKYCDVHGEVEDDEIPVDANEIIRIHGELKKQLQVFKDLHVKLSAAVAESDIDDLVDELASQIEEAEGYLDELE